MTDEQRLQRLADTLEKVMKRRNVTEAQLAMESGVSKRTVGNFLRPDNRKNRDGGELPSGTLVSLFKIARALDVGPWELLF